MLKSQVILHKFISKANMTKVQRQSGFAWEEIMALLKTVAGIARHISLGVLVAAVTTGTPTMSIAQTYPSRPITLLVPFAAGGAADVTARIVGEAMSQRLGQSVIVENVAGAGGTTGVSRAKNAEKDGYTILLGHMGTHAASVALYPKLAYDPRADFEPLGLATFSPIILFARKDLPVSNLQEFLAYARSRGDKITNGHSGVGSIAHITCALLASVGGLKPTMVPYRGNGPMVNDMLGGNVDYSCDLVVSVAPQVTSGSLKGLAVASPNRSPAVPDVPTATEGGLPEFRADAWTGLFAPKGTPPDILAKLRQALSSSLDDEKVKARLMELGANIPNASERTPEYLANLVSEEILRWKKIITEAGIKLD
jgi:tripartite-type tricarboxylate transporter receptor subunit TctC